MLLIECGNVRTLKLDSLDQNCHGNMMIYDFMLYNNTQIWLQHLRLSQNKKLTNIKTATQCCPCIAALYHLTSLFTYIYIYIY